MQNTYVILHQTSEMKLMQNPIYEKLPKVQQSKQKLTVKRKDVVLGCSVLSHWRVAWSLKLLPTVQSRVLCLDAL